MHHFKRREKIYLKKLIRCILDPLAGFMSFFVKDDHKKSDVTGGLTAWGGDVYARSARRVSFEIDSVLKEIRRAEDKM